ncbi:MAG: glycosyltransferase [Nitrospirota bacterium]|nr:glycosyltransferase [Nitrospirota bacterium]
MNDSRSTSKKHLAIFIPSLAGGGVARVMLHLANAFSAAGHQVDLLLCQTKGAFLDSVPPHINVVTLQPSTTLASRLHVLRENPTLALTLLFPILLPNKPPKTIRYLSDLTAYLIRAQPDALLSAKTHANLVAIWARKIAAVQTRVVVSERSTLSTVIRKSKKWRWRFVLPLLRMVYSQADRVITVSRGVTDDVSSCTGLSQERITTIYNPLLTEHINAQSILPVPHPWFHEEGIPVILGVGRLVPAKDFPTLLKAFAHIRAKQPARLVILGEGRERQTLEKLATDLGIDSDLSLPGFADNPYAFMSRASVFVLSSMLEGLPNALIEALACGCPVVSTNCRSGPQEILDNGAFGPLVPVGDDKALAKAIMQTLEHPSGKERLRSRAREFDIHTIAEHYYQALFLK